MPLAPRIALARLASLFGVPPVPPLERRAQGVVDASDPDKRRMVVTVDALTFRQVRRAAKAADISVSEALRQIIRRGLDVSPVKE